MRTTFAEIGHSRNSGKPLREVYVPDDSLNNGSSIAICIETPTSNILFLGDSWAQDIEEAIERREIGRASCRERVCQYVSISVVAVSLQKKKDKAYREIKQ